MRKIPSYDRALGFSPSKEETMKTRLVVTTVVALMALIGNLSFAAETATTPPLAAKDFQVENWSGQVVLVDFWASWCKPCQKSLPWLVELQARYGDEGLQVVTVNLDRDGQAAVPMASALPPGIVQVHDPEGVLAEERNLQGMPSAYLYDSQGNLSAIHVGFTLADTASKEQEIEALLRGDTGHVNAGSVGADVAGVQPWERDLLAAPGMEIDDDPLETALNEHTYFSKEASSGGIGSAGGGCGCN